MKLRKTVSRMLGMCPAAWAVFIHTLRFSCLLLFLSVVLLIRYETPGESYRLYQTAMALYELPQALLLVAVLGSVCIEDLQN